MRVEPYVDFVCPHCGVGIRRWEREILLREFSSPARYTPALYHAFLRCDSQRCAGRAEVHTLAESDSPNAEPRIAVSNWKLEGINCHEGHDLKQPLELKGHTVT